MKKKSEKITEHLGLRGERQCFYPKRAGHLRWWDCLKGSPMGMGPNGEKWAVEWIPGGKGKPLFVHLRNRDTAGNCFRELARGQADRWGLFELLESESSRDVSQSSVSETTGGGGVATVPVISRDTPLSVALNLAFDTPRVVALFEEHLDAKRPIYATLDGDQQVVGYEPDWATRKDTLKTMIAYRDGLAVKRVEEVKRHEISTEEGMARLANDPKARAALANYIGFLDNRDRERLAKVTKGKVVVDVPAKNS